MVETPTSTNTVADGDVAAMIRKLEQDTIRRLDVIEAKVVASPSPPDIDWYKRILDAAQLFVIAAGFALTVWQVGRIQESTDLGAWNSVSTEWLKVDRYFLEHPEMRQYFYRGKAVTPGNPDRDKIEGVANYVLNFLDYAISTSNHIVSEYPHAATFIKPEVWKAYVEATYFQSPAVCDLLRKLAKGYSPATRRMGEEACPPPQ